MGNIQGARSKGKRRKASADSPPKARESKTPPPAAPVVADEETVATTKRKRRPPRKSQTHVGPASAKAGTKKEVAYVELLKQTGQSLGLILAGGADKGQPLRVGGLRPNGIANQSESLQVGDRILAVNGKSTDALTHDDVIQLVKNAEEIVNLEIEYDAPLDGPSPDDGVTTKTVLICLKKEGSTFGFTISGGVEKGRPLTVSYVRPGTAAYKSGTMKAGDRLLRLNGMALKHATHSEVVLLLKNAKRKISLELEYDVTLHGSQSPGEPIYISHIKDAGVADRCGALHVGDRLLSINGKALNDCSLSDSVQMLIHSDVIMKLEIIPGVMTADSSHKGLTYVDEWTETYSDTGYGATSSPEMFSRGGSTRGSFRGTQLRVRRPSLSSLGSRRSSSLLGLSSATPCHTETLTIELKPDSYGYGFNIQGLYDVDLGPFIVCDVESDSPAYLHSEFMVGDRVLVLNGLRTNGMPIEQAWKMIRDSRHGIAMETEIDIAESVIPGMGTFDVKLIKRGGSLGITINGDPDRGGFIWISQIKKGGVAHRTGTIEPGDTLLAIDGRNLEKVDMQKATALLKATGDIVTLQISKDSATAGPPGSVLFSVELIRRGASLGITVHGSENPGDPVVISQLKQDGVAFRSGTLKVGDRILAINGTNLRMRTLVEAVDLLQTAGDVVKLKICRDPNPLPLPTNSVSQPDYAYQFNSLPRRLSIGTMSSMSNTLPRRNAAPDRSTQRRLAMLALKNTGRSTPPPEALDGDASPEVTGYGIRPSLRSHLDDSYVEPEIEADRRRSRRPAPYGGEWREPRRRRSLSLDFTVAAGDEVWGSDDELAERRFGNISPMERSHFEPAATRRRRRSIQRDTSSDSSDTGMSSPAVQRARLRRNTTTAAATTTTTTTSARIDSSRVASALAIGAKSMLVKRIKLRRKSSTANFGFSVADGVGEKGVFVKAVRRTGPADGKLLAYDKLLQVNGINVHDVDCCKVVPILAEAGPVLNMIIARRRGGGGQQITGDL
ncbi:glutamate receptor-interacting protein 1-like isoform X2 [Oscarella lobularis]|uniref:glutamate receptor-interacting protein 1-like isoform X2 n=1 Tax=Oscarella lobularis TaxID=121494 RepID=UPI003313D7D5